MWKFQDTKPGNNLQFRMWILSLGPHSLKFFSFNIRHPQEWQCFQSHSAKPPLLFPSSFITDLMLELFHLIPQILKQHQKLAVSLSNSSLLNVNSNVYMKHFAINSFIKNFEAFLLKESSAQELTKLTTLFKVVSSCRIKKKKRKSMHLRILQALLLLVHAPLHPGSWADKLLFTKTSPDFHLILNYFIMKSK